jgi:hypothetical protein
MDLCDEELLERCECAAEVDEIPQVGAGLSVISDRVHPAIDPRSAAWSGIQ